MKRNELLTEKERKALDLSAKLWNAIVEMEKELMWHQDDIHEHRRDINNIQNRIMARSYLRINNGIKQNPSE